MQCSFLERRLSFLSAEHDFLNFIRWRFIMIFKTRYNANDFEKPVLECKTPSLTQQQFKEDSDINNIVGRFVDTGMIGNVGFNEGQYIDVSNIPDYQTALNTVIQAEEQFNSLPAEVRKRFNYDPAEMLSFVENEDNYEEAFKLGLVEPRLPKAIQTEDNLEPPK